MSRTKPSNPFRRWLQTQPRSVTQVGLADRLGCRQSYISDLMSENSRILPSLTLALQIEDLTDGKVSPRAMVQFAMANRKKRAQPSKEAA